MHVGSELKAARKKAGISVEGMSNRTKIPVTRLVALEKNDFKNLPTGLYLFSTVRAYAREVHIDPEPIVERLRAEFADQDALEALHALDATGALDAKNLANTRRSRDAHVNMLRYGAIAAAVVLMAAGAGAYLHSPPRRTTTIAAAIDVAGQSGAGRQPAPTEIHIPKPRAAAVAPGLHEAAAAISAVPEEPADSPANIEEPTTESPEAANAR